MDPLTMMLGSSLISGIGGLFGAHSQDKANKANLAAQQQRYNDMSGMVNSQMQTGPNPFSQQIMSYLGRTPQGPGSYDPTMMGNPMQMKTPGQVTPDMVTGTQGYNAGQDALLQMMNRNIQAPRDASIDPMLQSGTGQFDNSELFKALAPMDNQLINDQVNQLHGSAGSFGKRFGTAMIQDEGLMRGQFANNIAGRNAGIQQQSYENAAGRNLQAAGLQAQREQFFGQQPFQNAQLQQQAAQTYGQNWLGQQGLNQQGQIANQNTGLNAQQFNVNSGMNAQQFNIGNMMQQAMQNQQAQNNAGQFNANMMQNNNQFNMQQMLQGLGMAGQFQQNQQGQNNQLLSILGSMGMPQQQASQMPNALGDFGSSMMMMPMLAKMLQPNGQQAGAQGFAAGNNPYGF